MAGTRMTSVSLSGVPALGVASKGAPAGVGSGICGVALAPGASFGASGEGWVRFALVREPDALDRAVARIADYLD